MKKTYKTDNNILLVKVGRAKKVFYNMAGDPYFVWNGHREKFADIPRLYNPVTFKDGDTDRHCGGYITLCNVFGVLVEILDGGDAV